MIYADFWVPEDNGKQNPNKSFTKKHKNMFLAVMFTN